MESDTRANELYWGSNKSVNQIADELELSKGMLYGMIRPLPAELSCPRCSTGMEFANRTARERGLITCPSCGLEIDEASARDEQESAPVTRPAPSFVPSIKEPPVPRRPAPPRVPAVRSEGT